jgi:hypothetical protein
VDLPIGPVVSVFRAVRDALQDRPNVRIIGSIVDHGRPRPNVLTPWIGVYVHLEVHATGRQPVRVTGAGFELNDRSHLLFGSGDRLPSTLTRPEALGRRIALDSLQRDLASRKVRGFVVTASPERTFRQPLPKAWRKGIPGP